MCAAPKGNQFWKLADPEAIGRPRTFKSTNDLWKAACDYFKECDNSPLISEETTTSDKGVFHKVIKHKVPYTWEGLYVYLGVSHLDDYKKRKEFSGILTHIGNIIRNQKFTGAAAGIFNASIIARDLGLSDKKEHDHTTKGESINKAPDLSNLTEEELALLAKLKGGK